MNRKVEISLFAGGGELLLVGSKIADNRNNNPNVNNNDNNDDDDDVNENENENENENNNTNESNDENDLQNNQNTDRNNSNIHVPNRVINQQLHNNIPNTNPSHINNTIPVPNNQREDLGTIQEYLLKITDTFSVSQPITITTSAVFLNSEGLSVSSCGMFLLCVMYRSCLLSEIVTDLQKFSSLLIVS